MCTIEGKRKLMCQLLNILQITKPQYLGGRKHTFIFVLSLWINQGTGWYGQVWLIWVDLQIYIYLQSLGGWLGAGCFRIASNENTHCSSVQSLILHELTQACSPGRCRHPLEFLDLEQEKKLLLLHLLGKKCTLPDDEGSSKITLQRVWTEWGH